MVLTWRKLTCVLSTSTWWARVANTAMPAKKGNCKRYFFRSTDRACAPGPSLRGYSTCPCGRADECAHRARSLMMILVCSAQDAPSRIFQGYFVAKENEVSTRQAEESPRSANQMLQNGSDLATRNVVRPGRHHAELQSGWKSTWMRSSRTTRPSTRASQQTPN